MPYPCYLYCLQPSCPWLNLIHRNGLKLHRKATERKTPPIFYGRCQALCYFWAKRVINAHFTYRAGYGASGPRAAAAVGDHSAGRQLWWSLGWQLWSGSQVVDAEGQQSGCTSGKAVNRASLRWKSLTICAFCSTGQCHNGSKI